MGRIVAAYTTYILVLLIMAISALWVVWDARKIHKPWGEALVWGLFAGSFLGLGPLLYIFWKRHFEK
ncbi:MAG: hypothetical protein ACYDEQ_15475 [Desulfocucumaceae bacterium]